MATAPTRREWRVDHPLAVAVEKFTAFGWAVHRHSMPQGSTITLKATTEVERQRAPNRTLYTQGRILVELQGGSALDDRVPGMYSGDRPTHPAGVITLTAAEPSEFWCFNWHANRGALPDLTPLRFPDGGYLVGRDGGRILVCSGQIGAQGPGESFIVGDTAPPVQPGTYALVIGGEREA